MLRFTAKKTLENAHPGDPDVHLSDRDGTQMAVTSPIQSSLAIPDRIEDSSMSSETQSEEDYDENFRPNILCALDSQVQRKNERKGLSGLRSDSTSYSSSRGGNGITHDSGSQFGSSASNADHARPKQNRKFKDFVFSRQVSTFDAQSEAAANSPFHGFYNLFWLSIALMICKISASNWRTYGNLLGPSDILKTMFHKDVIVLLISDGIMCGLTAVTWLLQKLVLINVVNWDREGWILQHIWQAVFIAGTVKWTVYRDWPWTHTVFFVLHALVMLMKQHSYAFYNGHLSTIYHRRQMLLVKLKKLEFLDCTGDPLTDSPIVKTSISPLSASLASGHHSDGSSPDANCVLVDAANILKTTDTAKALGHKQLSLFEGAIKNEIDCLGDELKGTASNSSNVYPHNLTFMSHYKWIPLPTVVYELEYPRLEKINWSYLAEKVAAMIGIIFVMIQVSQYYIYPGVLVTIEMRENNMPLVARFREFPWLLGDLIFPFMMEYLLTWYLIWETVLNILAELTYFADRHFYDAWWNSGNQGFLLIWPSSYIWLILRHSILGPVCARLESPSPYLPSSPCLPQFYIVIESQQAYRDHHHLFPFCLRSRIYHVVHLQKVARIFACLANVSIAARSFESNKLVEGPENTGQSNILARYIYRSKRLVQFVSHSMTWRLLRLLDDMLRHLKFTNALFSMDYS